MRKKWKDNDEAVLDLDVSEDRAEIIAEHGGVATTEEILDGLSERAIAAMIEAAELSLALGNTVDEALGVFREVLHCKVVNGEK